MTKLYNVPRNSLIRVHGIETSQVIMFYHLDGMYSLCAPTILVQGKYKPDTSKGFIHLGCTLDVDVLGTELLYKE